MKILMAAMGLDIGGAETHILELAKELARRGDEIIVASNGGVYVEELKAAGIRHYQVPMHKRSLPLMLESYRRLSRIIRRERPDIVHAHARIPAFLCGFLQKRYRFPFVTTAHWVFKTTGGLRLLTNWGDRTVAVSEDIRDYLKDNYAIPDEHIFVTINGIDAEKFSPDVSGQAVREAFAIPADAPVIAHVSRMDAGRELAAATLIASAESIAAAVPGAVILIAGAGDVFDALSAEADAVNARLGYRCIVMAGARTDVNEIIAAGDMFVGVSRAALEAMAAAKPVIVAGNEGYLGVFAPDKLETALEGNFCCRGCGAIEPERFARDVTKCLLLTAAQKRVLGDYGRSVILEHYSVARMADDTVKAYRAAIPTRKVVMSGYYGFSNAGDEAILAAVHDAIKRAVPDCEITVLSGAPAATAETYGCRAVHRFNPFSVWNAVRKCDLLVSGGGSLLQDATSTRSLVYYAWVIRLAELMGKKVMLYANGIGPVRHAANRRLVGRAANGANVITLRDENSLTELESMQVTKPVMAVTADPVYLLEPAWDARVDEILGGAGVPEGDFIAVSVRNWPGLRRFAAKLAWVCDGLSRKYNEPVVFVSMQAGEDKKAAEAVMAHMTVPAFEVGGCEPAELMGVIGRADIMLSMRLHSVIFAARMGVPVAGISYDPKVASSLEMLNMPSLGTVRDFDEVQALAACQELYGRRLAARSGLKVRLKNLQRLARDNEDFVRMLIG